ncbi:MAG: response regulator [Desulfococcaceae bacterium]
MTETQKKQDGSGIPEAGPPRILVVEDNPFNREMLKKILIQEGFAADEAANGHEAIEKLKTASYRMIFMDILMPKMDGIETIQRIREMGIATPIIIVTAMSSKPDRRRCLEAGGDGFLTKPLDTEQIREQIERFTASPEPTAKAAEPEKTPEKSPISATGSILSGYRVLLVEEDRDRAERFSRTLAEWNLIVERVANGTLAWELIHDRRRRFDMVVSNMFTSDIDGLGLLARIKQEFANVPVFIYAAEADADAFNLATQLGAEGVLTEFEFSSRIPGLMESAVYRAGRKAAPANSASTVSQVRQAQNHLVKLGCTEACEYIDVAHQPLTDAGGDLALCRKFPETGRCGVLLGDVSGHSVTTSYISAMFLGMLSTLWSRVQDPTDLLKALNRELNKPEYAHHHLCASVLSWDPATGHVKLATAGNPGGMVVGEGPDGTRTFRELSGGGMGLGLIPEDSLFLEEEFRLCPGDWLFLFSDGIQTDAFRTLLEAEEVDLSRHRIRGVGADILNRLTLDRNQTDDMALVALHPPAEEIPLRERFTIPATYEGVDMACDWAEGLSEGRIPAGHDPYLLLLAVREALLNAVIHGNRLNPNTFVEIVLESRPGELRISVTDAGSGFTLPEEAVSMEKVDPRQTGGRGLAAIQSVTEEFQIQEGTVILVFQDRKG